MTREIDEAFIGRVYKTSAYVWAVVAIVSLIAWNWLAAVGWTVGSAVSFGILRSLDWIIRRTFVPGSTSAQSGLAKFSLIKLAVITIIIVVMVLLGGRSFALIVGFCAGVVLTQAVIFLKVLGMLICQHSND